MWNQTDRAISFLDHSYHVMGLFFAPGHGEVFGAGRDGFGIGHNLVNSRQRCSSDRFHFLVAVQSGVLVSSLLYFVHGLGQREGSDLTHFHGCDDLNLPFCFWLRVFATEEVFQGLLGYLEEPNYTRLFFELSELVESRLLFFFWFLGNSHGVHLIQVDFHGSTRTGQYWLQLLDDDGDTRIPLQKNVRVAFGRIQRQALSIDDGSNHNDFIHVGSHLMLRI